MGIESEAQGGPREMPIHNAILPEEGAGLSRIEWGWLTLLVHFGPDTLCLGRASSYFLLRATVNSEVRASLPIHCPVLRLGWGCKGD